MKTKITAITALAAAAFLMQGCGSSNATYVDSGGSRTLISANKINMADWNQAASALVNDMLTSGVLEKFERPVVMKVSRIVNRTSESVDTDLLTKQITIALNNSGNVLVVSDDPYTQELAQTDPFTKEGQALRPKITMTGKIIEDRESIGNTREVTYVFMLSINSGGVAIWEGQKQIAKQQEKSSWGW